MTTTTWLVMCDDHTTDGYQTREDAEAAADRLNHTAPCRLAHTATTRQDRLDMLADAIIEATGNDPLDDPELFALAWGDCADCGRTDATAILNSTDNGEARRCFRCGILDSIGGWGP